MFQPSITSDMCSMPLSLKSKCDSRTLVELQLKLHRSAFVKFVIRLLCNLIVIRLCWARMMGQGSSPVIALSERSMVDSTDRFADSMKTRGSITSMILFDNDNLSSRCRLVNTPSYSQTNST